jgi:hypothetical protein
VPVLPAGEVGQEQGDDTPCRFLNAIHFWRQHRLVPHLWPWPEPELDTSGQDSLTRVIMTAPENFRFFGRISNSSSIGKGFEI